MCPPRATTDRQARRGTRIHNAETPPRGLCASVRVPAQRCARAQSCQRRAHTYTSHTCTHDSPWALDTQADGPGDRCEGVQRPGPQPLLSWATRSSGLPRAPAPSALRAPPPHSAAAPAGQPSLGSGPAQLSRPARENEQGRGRSRRPRAEESALRSGRPGP